MLTNIDKDQDIMYTFALNVVFPFFSLFGVLLIIIGICITYFANRQVGITIQIWYILGISIIFGGILSTLAGLSAKFKTNTFAKFIL